MQRLKSQALLKSSGSTEHAPPSVSIIMPVYNGGPEIVRAIQKAFQKFERTLPSFTVIVVEDGSTDNARTLFKRMKDNMVTVVGYPANLGKVTL
jgi:glycosyltransferase involved in cell wall biosynthesis